MNVVCNNGLEVISLLRGAVAASHIGANRVLGRRACLASVRQLDSWRLWWEMPGCALWMFLWLFPSKGPLKSCRLGRRDFLPCRIMKICFH